MTGPEIEKLTAALSRQFEERLRIKGDTLARQVRRAGRMLPRKQRREARTILQAQQVARHPKLSRMINGPAVTQSAHRLGEWLATVDPKERRIDRLLGIAGSVAFAVLVLGAVVITLIVQRGLV